MVQIIARAQLRKLPVVRLRESFLYLAGGADENVVVIKQPLGRVREGQPLLAELAIAVAYLAEQSDVCANAPEERRQRLGRCVVGDLMAASKFTRGLSQRKDCVGHLAGRRRLTRSFEHRYWLVLPEHVRKQASVS